MSKPKIDAETACQNYAIAVAEVRRLTGVMRSNRCTEASKPDYQCGDPGAPTCLDDYFTAPQGPNGERPRQHAIYEEMCDPCKTRLEAFRQRREWRIKLGAAKRTIETIGKRGLPF